jgi:hypothetical protein
VNIFFIDNNPRLAATYLCDQHVVKMLLESAQLLSTLAREKCGDEKCDSIALYKATHKNHPCSIWLREHPANYRWLFEHVVEMHSQYISRYDKQHKSYDVACKAHNKLWNSEFADISLYYEITTPPQCMPARYKHADYVTAYRRYYVGEKIPRFATWKKGTPQPEWTLDSKYVVPQVKLTLCHKAS